MARGVLCVEGGHRYEARWDNASTRPGYHQVFGNTLAEVDGAIGEITASLERFEKDASSSRRQSTP